MTERVVRGRSRVLLSDSSSSEDDVRGPSLVAPPHVDHLEDEIEDGDDDDDGGDDDMISMEDDEPPVTILPVTESSIPVTRSPRESNMSGVEGGGSPLHQILWRRGIHVHPEWVESFVGEMEGSQPGFSSLGLEEQGELAFAYLLISDFNEVGAGCLPDSFESLHKTELPGPYVLQVDEMCDVGAPLRERYHERKAGTSRCLKLSMTDGVQRVVGIEYQPIPALHNLSPSGIKICLRSIFVRRGVFLLTCESVEVIGGFVQRMEEARQRAVHEVNKPARGSRNRRGQAGDRSLFERATAAAWPGNADEANPAAAGIPYDNSSGQSANVGHSIHVSLTETRLNVSVPQRTPAVVSTRSETRSNVAVPEATPGVGSIRTETRSNVAVQEVTPGVGSIRIETRLNATVQQTTPAGGSAVQILEVKRKQTTIPWVQTSVNDAELQENSPKRSTNTIGSSTTQQRVVEQTTARDSFAQPSAAGVQIPMTLDSDEDEFESIPAPSHRPHTSAFNEEPFTYLAFLKEKRSAEPGNDAVVGKVKCVLTGVKEFRYKDTEEFALFVTVDDGSLATGALIHHEVVQRKVGFSPKEVNRALDGKNPQEIREMKAIMRRFQAFLRNFEGMVVVHYKQSLDMPVISYMEEGVKAGDLSALQNRVSNDTSLRQPGMRLNPEFIDVSP